MILGREAEVPQIPVGDREGSALLDVGAGE
jgi:hypothetical protein